MDASIAAGWGVGLGVLVAASLTAPGDGRVWARRAAALLALYLIALALASRARVAMIQAQDALGLGSEGRMNVPGTAAGSWQWRLDALPGREEAARLREITEAAGRLARAA